MKERGKKIRENNQGFSLVELIIVIAIMVVLVGVLAPQYLGYVSKSRVATDIQNAQAIATRVQVAIADAESSGGTFVANSTGTDLTTLMGKKPVSKVDSSKEFSYTYSDTAGVTVSVGTTELYPQTPNDRNDTTSPWYAKGTATSTATGS